MKKWVKRILYTLVGIIALLLLVFLLLQTQWAKDLIKEKVESYVANKTNTSFTIGSLDYSLPKWIELNDVFMLDQQDDTLLFGGKIRVDVAMLKIIKGKFDIDKIHLENVVARLDKKDTDSVFNFQFIIDAFNTKEDNAVASKDTSAIDFSLNKVELRNVRFSLTDGVTGNATKLNVKDFDLSLNDIDINRMYFDIKDISTDQLYLSILNNATTSDTTTGSSSVLPLIRASKINISKSYVEFIDNYSRMVSKNSIGELSLNDISNFDQGNNYTAQSLILDSSDILFQHYAPESVGNKNEVVIQKAASPFNLFVENIHLSNNRIQYDNTAMPDLNRGVDWSHLNLTDLNLRANDLKIGSDTIQVELKLLSVKDKSGLTIDTLSAVASLIHDEMLVNDLLLRTPYSSLNANAQININAFNKDSLKSTLNNAQLLDVSPSYIGEKDVALLAPEFYDQHLETFQKLQGLGFEVKVSGTAAKANISNVHIRSKNGQYINLQTQGVIYQFTDPQKMSYELNIRDFTAKRELIQPFIKTEQPLYLPSLLRLNGSLKGNLQQVTAGLRLMSEYGVANIAARVVGFDNPETMKFSVNVDAQNFETGKWIGKGNELGQFNGKLFFESNAGFDLKKGTLNASVDANSFIWKEHVVGPFAFKANVKDGNALVTGEMNDELLAFNTNGNFVIADYPTGILNLNLRKADLYQLGITKDTVAIQLFVGLDIRSSVPSSLDAHILIDSMELQTGKKSFKVDSTSINGFVRNDSTIFELRGGLVNGDITSDVYYDRFSDVIQNVLNKYMPVDKPVKAVEGSVSAELHFNANPVYQNLAPGLSFTNVHLSALIDTRKDSALNVKIDGDRILYNDLLLSNVDVHAFGLEDSILVKATSDTFRAGGFELLRIYVDGGYAQNGFDVVAGAKDEKDKEQYRIGVQGELNDELTTLILTDPLRLNYDVWQVDTTNRIVFGSGGVRAEDFRISNKGQEISINSNGTALNAPIDIIIKNFEIASVTRIMNQDTLLANGIVNANLIISDFDNDIPNITGKATIDSAQFREQVVGDIAIDAGMESGRVKFNVALTGNGNDVQADGVYADNLLDADVDINSLSMTTVQALSVGKLKESSGSVNGTLKITGSISDPRWNGKLNFEKTSTRLSDFGSVIRMDDQSIDLNYPVITLNDFTIKDSLGNPLKVNGTITQTSDMDFKPDIRLVSREFLVLNNTQTDNEMLYGNAKISIDGVIKGSLSSPDLTGDVKLKNGSSITYVKQKTVASIKDREQFMEFIDRDTIPDLLTHNTYRDILELNDNKLPGSNMNLNMNLSVEPEANVVIIIDPATKDQLSVKGEASLSLSTAANGDILLTGIYELNKGSYNLNFSMVNRKFDLLEGSTIQFNGNPMNAVANVTAVYEVETPPSGLIGNEVSGTPTGTEFNRKIPFQILLKITGTITKPQLGFDIQLKEKAEGVSYETATTVENKLQQLRIDPSAMNKQVFGLLVFNRFVGEQSSDFFGGSNSVSANNVLANESVSAFLSAAIDQLASDLIQGVDIDVNLKNMEDASGDKRTDLNLALGKTFFNDRLNVTFGKRFTIDGQDPATETAGDNLQYIPDIQTTYKLSKDGRYLLRAYRINQYEAIMDGYYIETGIAFTLKMDYDKFKEIFNRKKKND